eukprot:1158306-Pelagomonas_calceolata.AAC.11
MHALESAWRAAAAAASSQSFLVPHDGARAYSAEFTGVCAHAGKRNVVRSRCQIVQGSRRGGGQSRHAGLAQASMQGNQEAIEHVRSKQEDRAWQRARKLRRSSTPTKTPGRHNFQVGLN